MRSHPIAIARARRRRHKKQREGIVMLVVMLVLMFATASAAVSIRTTQSELRAAGEDRMAQQTRDVSEIAIASTVSWIDELGASGQWQALWNGAQAAPAPIMADFAEPNLPADARNFAMRTALISQLAQRNDAEEMTPVNAPQAPGAVTQDLIGSFGPRQAYVPSDYVVDLTDCVPAPVGLTPGMPSPPPPGTPQPYYCVLIAHARTQLPVAQQLADAQRRRWNFGNGPATYVQDPFMATHDSRATIVTPEM